MDTIDQQVVQQLQIDARRSNKALAESIGVSPSTMLSRTRSLEDRGVIRGYHADVALPALGRQVEAMVSVRLLPKTPDAVEQFVEAIWSLEETIAVSLVTGAFDVLVHLSVKDISSLSEAVLRGITSAPNVADEQTAIVFEHRRKTVVTPIDT